MRIVLPSTFWLHFRGSQALQKACQMVPKWNPKLTKSCINHKILEFKKHVKQNCQKISKSIKMIQNWVLWGGGEGRKSSSIFIFSEIRQNGSLGCPGLEKASQRHPKGSQKASRKPENDVQKASSRHSNSISN